MIEYDKPILDENGQPIKILEAAAHACIRVQKQMRALKKIGYEVHGLANKISYASSDNKTLTIWQNEAQFKAAIKMHIDGGIRWIQFHNEPHKPAHWIREVINEMGVQDKVKLIVDCHDLETIRRDVAPPDELEMLGSADALIYVSEPIQTYINRIHRITVPTTTLYSYCNSGIVNYDESKIAEKRALVYQGGLNPPNEKQLNDLFPYRDIYWIMKRLVEMGNELHIFAGNLSAFETYQDIGAVTQPPTDYDILMPALTKFKYGVIVFNNKDGKQNQVNLTLTNKMQEHLMAGLPSLVCWCPETEKYVKKHNIGFVFDDIEDIGDTSGITPERYQEVMESIKVKRQELVMENYIWKVENLFAGLLGLERKGIPEDIKQLAISEYAKSDIAMLM